VTGGTTGLKPSIEVARGIHLLVPEDAAHDFIAAGILVEIELCREMTEEMGVDL
jgi:hypothetical protein